MTRRLMCSKYTDWEHKCPREAVELLMLRSRPVHEDDEWEIRGRCDQHRAADDVPILGHILPAIEYVIVPLGPDIRIEGGA